MLNGFFEERKSIEELVKLKNLSITLLDEE
jgi:hypothetical protein